MNIGRARRGYIVYFYGVSPMMRIAGAAPTVLLEYCRDLSSRRGSGRRRRHSGCFFIRRRRRAMGMMGARRRAEYRTHY